MRARKRHAWWDTQAPSEGSAWFQGGLFAVLAAQAVARVPQDQGWWLVASIVTATGAAAYALMSIPTALWLRRNPPPADPPAEPEEHVWPFWEDDSERR